MEILIYVVIATVLVLAIINNIITSAVEAVRQNTAQQFTNLTKAIEYMFERHQTAMIEKMNDLAVTMGYTLNPTDSSVKDVLLYDVAKWAIEQQGISTGSVQRHFSVGFSRAGKIVDQLYGMGVCGESQETGMRPMLITMAELDAMDKSGVFKWQPTKVCSKTARMST